MDAQELLVGVRWELVQQLAAKPSTGLMLARATGTSPANVSQHLKLLELGGIVARVRSQGKSQTYKLARRMAFITLLDGTAKRVVVPLDNARTAELKLLIEGRASGRFVRAFLAQHEDLVRTFTAFGTLHEHDDIPLLVIADDVRPLRKEFANVPIGPRKIIIWSHTPEEFEEGLARGDSYFTEKLRTVLPLADPKELFTAWRAKYL